MHFKKTPLSLACQHKLNLLGMKRQTATNGAMIMATLCLHNYCFCVYMNNDYVYTTEKETICDRTQHNKARATREVVGSRGH